MCTTNSGERCDAWYDGSAVCVIAVGSYGDPLDLGEQEVVELIKKLQASLKQAKCENCTPKKENLEKESKEIQDIILGKALSKVFRPRTNELVLEFTDGTRFFVDAKSDLEFSIT